MQSTTANHYELVIIGTGPAGLSAAGRAAQLDLENGASSPTYILLESASDISSNVRSYQKGKHVMNEPGYLDLRSPMRFSSGSREEVLGNWEDDTARYALNIRYDSEVTGISGSKGAFDIQLGDKTPLGCSAVVLASGTSGNVRLIGVENDRPSDFVRYTLPDPYIFSDKVAVVIGAGDSAIEDALALSKQNYVHIINRRSEFSRAKAGNLKDVLNAINDSDSRLECHYDSSVVSLQLPAAQGDQGCLVLTTPQGERTIPCDLIIARLGSLPPRAFLEKCGLTMSSQAAGALPDLDRQYQSDVQGIYLIGALSGYPLIKQAMNQGQDVVDFVAGNTIVPADHTLIVKRLGGAFGDKGVDDVLDYMYEKIPLLQSVSPIAFRELIIESRLLVSGEWADRVDKTLSGIGAPVIKPENSFLMEAGLFVNKFYIVVEGSVSIQPYASAAWESSGPGAFFGESCLFSGRSQSSSAVIGANSVIIEIPRRILIKLANSNKAVREGVDQSFVLGMLQAIFKPKIPSKNLLGMCARLKTQTFEAGEQLYEENTIGDCLYLVRSGTINLVRGENRKIIADQYAGELVGQLSLMGHPRRHNSAVATTRVEALVIDAVDFEELLHNNPTIRKKLEDDLSVLLQENNSLATHDSSAKLMGFLMKQGLGEATNALVIDSSLCVGCDNCEKACEDTHGGVSRLQRALGDSLGRFHVPTACRHCETPHCMKDCPPDAIHRTPSGSVYITDTCIGCGNCESNCPYNVIELVATSEPKAPLWSRLFNALSPSNSSGRAETGSVVVKHAMKCDACMSVSGGPACVRACPTGAAARLGSEQLLSLLEK